jgi:hypothetical protein
MTMAFKTTLRTVLYKKKEMMLWMRTVRLCISLVTLTSLLAQVKPMAKETERNLRWQAYSGTPGF